ncbi:MAG: glycosyltransferase family 4 protein [Candidatus Hadarchaeales archaeon]
MRIGIVTEFFPKSPEVEVRGGAEARAFHVAREIAKSEEVTVFTTREIGDQKESEFLGIRVIRLGKERRYSQKGSIVERLSFIVDGIKTEGELDIVDGYCFIAYPVAWLISRRLKIPAVATYHDVWLGRWVKNVGVIGIAGELLESFMLSRKWNRFIAVSQFTKRMLVKHGVCEEKIEVIPNGVDVEKIRKLEAKKEINPTICCISRLVEYKHVDDILRAVAEVKKELPDVKCKIVGTGPEEEKLRKLAAALKIEKNVDFLGFLKSHEKVMEVLKSSHVFCLASTVEGFGIVLLEAMAAGVPFVATKIEPLLEASGGQGGLFFGPGDIKDMAGKILAVLTDDNLRKKLVEEGEKWVENFRWEKIGRRVLEVYRDLTK